jgi:hypothetical protein
MLPHVPLMKRPEIADYEPGSDPEDSLVPKRAYDKITLNNMSQLKWQLTAVWKSKRHSCTTSTTPALKATRTASQHVNILKSEDKELFLRFAACFWSIFDGTRCPV